MIRSSLATAVVVLMGFTCGSSSSTPQGPTVASVSVQSSDLPSGMHRCDLSGDINSFLNTVKTTSPSTYTSTKAEWEAAQKIGAVAAQVVFYAESTANCKAVGSNTSGLSAATYKLVINFVFQFKDVPSAAKGYTNETVFGFNQAQLNGAGTVGEKTGLGPNSVTLSVSISNQSFFIARWQKKAFLVLLAMLNIDSATSQKVAVKEYGRIN